ncbi:autotransporter domain-containing protein [Citrobacter sp. R-1.5.2]|uniref:autotransporter domain-containing protein n=1 Tax=Citrobacter sp. R-1.5.2 TaxID=3046183 RepID=UPI002B24424B|nr:autotransporter domain-containing protein [Citrobacter sp. R-1.5.2]MEB2419491.1 autotransporter domain-containing protein [Citrobacter sp. R-1.5.2]
MRHKSRRTLLSQCIILSLTSISGYALADSSMASSGSDPVVSGLTQYSTSGYHYNSDTTDAVMTGGQSKTNIYLTDNSRNSNGHRGDNDTQSLTVNGTNMDGYYIQAYDGGTANIILENGTTADMIEAGGHDVSTNVNITVDNSTLAGENNADDANYIKNDKSYMGGASIFADSGSTEGSNDIAVENGSQLGGAIYSVTGGNNTIDVSGGSTVNGAIYAFNNTTSGRNNITVDGSTVTVDANNSTLQGYFEGTAENNYADSVYAGNKDAAEINASLQGQTIAMGVYGTQASNIALNNSTVTGSIAVIGDNYSTASTAQISLDGSILNGSINSADENSTTVQLNASTVNGNITTGAGDDTVTLTNKSTVTGDVDGGAGTDTLSMDADSSINGTISNFETINTTDNNNIDITSTDSTTWNIQNGSTLQSDTTGSNVQVNMTSDSHVDFGEVDGTNDSLTVTSIAPSSASQQDETIATFTTTSGNADNPDSAVEAQFSNGKQQVESRSGAYNYDNSLTIEQAAQLKSARLTAPAGTAYNVQLDSSRGELASDVQGAIAGLDAAKQAGRMVTDDLANRLDQVHLQSLYGHVADGAQIWGDFLYQNGDYSDDVDYKDITQGVQGGVDWTSRMANGDSLTGGIALAWTRSRDQNNNGSSNSFNNTVYGNYYSVYGGWQQALHDNLWSMFVDGSFSYGDMRYNMSASNVKDNTSGMTEALSGSSDGNLYTTQVRTGVNVLLPGDTVLQPYATLGWDKADENSFSDQEVTFGDNQVSEWNTSVGMRVTTKLADLNKNVELYPWVDARYQTEFSDNTDITAADYHNSDGNNMSMGIFGAGINTTIGKDFSLNTGVYFGTGDVDNDASVQAGISYHF